MSSPIKSMQRAGKILLGCALLATAAGTLAAQTTPSAAPTQGKTTLTVKITGCRNASGVIRIALYRDAKGFPGDVGGSVAAQSVTIDPQTMIATAVFKDLPQGVYAASVFHDEKMTGVMEFSSQGIPLSGYGASNNPDRSYGPPSPEQSKFTADQPQSSIEIKMIYW